MTRDRIQSLFQRILDDETRQDGVPAADLALLSAALDGPEAVQEALAAQAFLDAVESGRRTVPADLLACALAGGAPATKARKPRRVFWTWSVAAFAMAMAALAVVIVVTRQTVPTEITIPPEARTAPPPAMLPAGAETVVPMPQPRKIELAPEGPDVTPRRR